MSTENPNFDEFAQRKVSEMSPELRVKLEGWAKLVVVWHTGSDAFGKRVTGDARRVLRKTIDILEGKIADQYGGGKSFGHIEYENGLDYQEVRSMLAGGLSESERALRSRRRPKG